MNEPENRSSAKAPPDETQPAEQKRSGRVGFEPTGRQFASPQPATAAPRKPADMRKLNAWVKLKRWVKNQEEED